MNQNKNLKVKVHATFHRLHINKNIKFQTHILWKRRTYPNTQIPTRPRPTWSITKKDFQCFKKRSRWSSTWSTTKPKGSSTRKMYELGQLD